MVKRKEARMIMHNLQHQQMIVQRRLEQVLIALFEVGLAVWMIQIYQHHGVWAMGKKN